MQLIITFLQIYLFRKGPQDVPYSVGLMLSVLFIDAAVRILTFNLADIHYAWVLILIDYFFLIGFISIALWARKFSGRFVQTFTAALAIDLIGFAFLELINLISIENANLAYNLIELWSWAVLSFIMRQAMNVSILTASLVTFAYALVFLGFYFLFWMHL